MEVKDPLIHGSRVTFPRTEHRWQALYIHYFWSSQQLRAWLYLFYRLGNWASVSLSDLSGDYWTAKWQSWTLPFSHTVFPWGRQLQTLPFSSVFAELSRQPLWPPFGFNSGTEPWICQGQLGGSPCGWEMPVFCLRQVSLAHEHVLHGLVFRKSFLCMQMQAWMLTQGCLDGPGLLILTELRVSPVCSLHSPWPWARNPRALSSSPWEPRGLPLLTRTLSSWHCPCAHFASASMSGTFEWIYSNSLKNKNTKVHMKMLIPTPVPHLLSSLLCHNNNHFYYFCVYRSWVAWRKHTHK